MNAGLRNVCTLSFAAVLAGAAAAQQQPSDYVLVTSWDYTGGGQSLAAFDRRLDPVAEHFGAGGGIVSRIADGSRWVAGHLPDLPSALLRLDAAAQPVGSLPVAGLKIGPAVDAAGRVFAGTYTGLSGWSPDGMQLWATPWPSPDFTPSWVAADGAGQVHVVGHMLSWFTGGYARLLRYSADDGTELGSMLYPDADPPLGDYQLKFAAAAPDGTLWSNVGGFSYEPYYWGNARMLNTAGESLLANFKFGLHGHMSIYNPSFCLDGQGRVLLPDYWQSGYTAQPETRVLRYDPAQPTAPEAIWDLDDHLRGFALGSTGEELFAVTTDKGYPVTTHRLVRVNLVSGVRSSRTLGSSWSSMQRGLSRGDPSGFVFASSIDRPGDADGDAAPNGAETDSASNPFDPESRPDGPRLYVSFAPGTNAIEMTLVDPDGLRHPTKGIDFSTMSVTVGDSGNVFWPLLTLVTEASLSADGTTAHAVFGGLPLASDLKLRVEMSVRDRTGAVGWDWQATPPGDL